MGHGLDLICDHRRELPARIEAESVFWPNFAHHEVVEQVPIVFCMDVRLRQSGINGGHDVRLLRITKSDIIDSADKLVHCDIKSSSLQMRAQILTFVAVE